MSLVKSLTFLYLLVLPLMSVAKNSFLVAPGRVDFDLKSPKTQSFIITNTGDDRIRLSIEPLYIPIDDRSLAAGEHLNPETAAVEDLSQWVRVAPRALSLKPGQRRDIRISLRPGKELSPGDYRTHLLVSMKEISSVVNNESQSDNSVGMKLALKMETAVAVYGHMGERDPKLTISCQNQDDKTLINVLNASPWRFDGYIRLLEADSGKLIREMRVVSLRESKNTFAIEPELKGNFTAQWVGMEDQEVTGTNDCKL